MAGATAHGARSVSIAAARCFSVVLIPPIFSASALSTPNPLFIIHIYSLFSQDAHSEISLAEKKDHERSRIGGRPSRHPTTAEARSGPLRSVAGQLPPTTPPRTARAGVVKPGDHDKTRGVPDSAVRRTGHSAVGTQASSTAAARAIPSPRYASLPRRRFLLLLLHPRPSRSGARARPRW